MIPKLIHYCWFGKNPIPDKYQRCIDSWHKYLPDYEITCWNEDNFDINYCDYVKEAYSEKKWAFVSDYVRFFVLYNYGGIYLDTDVEIVKPLEPLIQIGPYMGMEYTMDDKGIGSSAGLGINPGLGMAAIKGMSIFKEILDDYNNSHYFFDGKFNINTVVHRTTNIFRKYGFKEELCIQTIRGVNIYPPEFLCPLNNLCGKLEMTNNSYSIHHYSATWANMEDIVLTKINQFGLRHGRLIRCMCVVVKLPFKCLRKGRKILKYCNKKIGSIE